jgi:hypothetical protein
MRLGWLALAAIVGCSQKKPAPPAQGSGSAQVAQAPAGSGSAAAPAGVLAFDTTDADDPFDFRDSAFGGKHPRLPAVNADGSLIADYDWAGGMPSGVMPVDFVLRKLGADTVAERVAIIDDKDSDAASDGDHPKLPAEIATRLAARGPKILARLQGFHSLDQLQLPMTVGSGELHPLQLGALTFDPDLVELRDGQGRVLHSAVLPDFSSGDKECSYTPRFQALYRDAATGLLYVVESYHYRDDCTPPPSYIFAWSTDPAKADPDAVARGLVVHQFDAAPAIAVTTNGQPAAALADKAKPADKDDVFVTTSRDGNSAWAAITAGDTVRASNVLVKTPKGWELAAATWTLPVDNNDANRDAKAGKLKSASLAGDPGDQSLRDAFAKMTTDGVEPATDLVAYGSGPGERTEGGAGFARAWNAAWKGKATVVSSIAKLAPSGTTGWVTATIELQKKGYKIPFTVFAVFDKAVDGHWSLVHIHFAV